MSRAVTQRAAAEASVAHLPQQVDRLGRLVGILFGHLCQRDDEQAANEPPRVAEDEARVQVEHRGAVYLVDYEYDEDARCADVTHIWLGPVDLLDWLGEEYMQPVPTWAERAAEEHLQRHAGDIRRAGRALDYAMASGNDLLMPAPVFRRAA